MEEGVRNILFEDWTMHWNFVDRNTVKSDPETADIALIDDKRALSLLNKKTLIIFLGTVEDSKKFFSVIEDPSAEMAVQAIKRANSYKEITQQNEESLYPQSQDKNSLEAVAHSLSVRVHQLIKQSEMRIALVDQMPVGVLGIDDESTVVLVNQKAVEDLGIEDIPIWGLPASTLLSDKADQFIKSEDVNEMTIERYGENILLRKAPFILEDNYAGTIIVLWKLNSKQEN